MKSWKKTAFASMATVALATVMGLTACGNTTTPCRWIQHVGQRRCRNHHA